LPLLGISSQGWQRWQPENMIDNRCANQ